MDKQKKIEEMAKVIDGDCGECYTCKYFEYKGINCTYLLSAEYLYNAGYRKIQANEVIRKIDESEQSDWLDGYKVGFKEGVIALRTQFKLKIDEICKEITEDK